MEDGLRSHSVWKDLLIAGCVAAFYVGTMLWSAKVAASSNPFVFYNVGAWQRVPPFVRAAGVPVRPHHVGYDGQFYLMIATDPWLQTRSAVAHIDAPAYRYRRIGLPALAYATCGGRNVPCIVWAIPALIFLALFFGAFVTAKIARRSGSSPLYALAWAVTPALSLGVPRYLPDAFAAGMAILAVYLARERRFIVAGVFAAVAALTRETTIFYAVALAVASVGLLEPRSSSAPGPAARLTAGAALLVPAVAVSLAWTLFLRSKFNDVSGESLKQFSFPFHGMFDALYRMCTGGAYVWRRMRPIGDLLSITAFMGASVTCIRAFARGSRSSAVWLGLLTALLGVFTGPKVWVSATSSARALDAVQVACVLIALDEKKRRYLTWPLVSSLPGLAPLVTGTLYPHGAFGP